MKILTPLLLLIVLPPAVVYFFSPHWLVSTCLLAISIASFLLLYFMVGLSDSGVRVGWWRRLGLLLKEEWALH